MELFDKMKESITIAGQEVSQKAKSATESVRLGNMIKSNDKMIEKLTYQVGLQCVNNHINEPNTEYDALFSEILRLQSENQRLQTELQQATAVNSCPHCGFNNNANAKFCVSCGAPLFTVPTPAAGERRCPKCGATNTNDAAFCVECGNSLPPTAPAENPSQIFQKTPAYENAPAVPQNRCPNCGFSNAGDAVFCVECGTPIPQAVPITNSDQSSEAEAAPISDTPSEPNFAFVSDSSQETISDSTPELISEPDLISDSESSPEALSATSASPVSLQKPETTKPADEPAPAGNICRNCGAVLDDDSLFCTECGTKRES